MRILSFDIEEWFHILDSDVTRTEAQWGGFETRIHKNTDRILDLLCSLDQKATFFCLAWIAKKYPEIIRKLDLAGHEIASHSTYHQLVYEQSRDEFREDLKTSIALIEDITGKKVRAFRAPGFSITENTTWAFEVLIENGIQIDCSVFPAPRAHGGFSSFRSSRPALISIGGGRLKEFPINLLNILGYKYIFSGGGYFRLLPYPLIKRMMNRSDYVMTYFHPRDFDPEQPLLKELSYIRRFKSYYGIASAFRRLELLLMDFTFVDLDTADRLVDWNKAETIEFK